MSDQWPFRLVTYNHTTHLFSHFRCTDFRETWQEYVNPCTCRWIVSYTEIFLLSGLFFPKTDFYRAMHVVLARYCYRKSSVRPSVRLSVCLSVRPSVTLRYRGLSCRVGWFNQCDLNYWFKSQFKSTDFLSEKNKWLKSYWRFHLPMKNYNKQKQMYCFFSFIQLIQLFVDWFYSHWFRNFNSVQRATRNVWEIFRNFGLYMMLYSII